MIESIAIAPFLLFLLCHLVGDFLAQSDWMALNKNKRTFPCLVHCLIYTACFLVLTVSWKALLFIFVTHFIIDRFPIIVKRLIWTKNMFPLLDYPPFKYCDTTGYYDDSPYNTEPVLKEDYAIWVNNEREKILAKYGRPRHFFITIWLYIITDNTLHLICNGIALVFLGV
jgi:hypothetical protein